MAALTWDADSKKLYSTGNKEGILFAPLLSTKGTHSRYGTGVAWNGLANVTETPGGAEANDTYADDIKYISLRGAETFNQTIEAYMAPDEWAQCDGQATTGTATSDNYKIGMFGQQTRKAFGLYLSRQLVMIQSITIMASISTLVIILLLLHLKDHTSQLTRIQKL